MKEAKGETKFAGANLEAVLLLMFFCFVVGVFYGECCARSLGRSLRLKVGREFPEASRNNVLDVKGFGVRLLRRMLLRMRDAYSSANAVA